MSLENTPVCGLLKQPSPQSVKGVISTQISVVLAFDGIHRSHHTPKGSTKWYNTAQTFNYSRADANPRRGACLFSSAQSSAARLGALDYIWDLQEAHHSGSKREFSGVRIVQTRQKLNGKLGENGHSPILQSVAAKWSIQAHEVCKPSVSESRKAPVLLPSSAKGELPSAFRLVSKDRRELDRYTAKTSRTSGIDKLATYHLFIREKGVQQKYEGSFVLHGVDLDGEVGRFVQFLRRERTFDRNGSSSWSEIEKAQNVAVVFSEQRQTAQGTFHRNLKRY